MRLNDSLQKLSFDQLIRELGMMKLKLGVIIPLTFEKGTLAAVLTAMLVVSNSGLLQDADASLRDKAKERANKVLDKHIRID